MSDTRAWPKRLRLADDFWFVAHDDASGRSRLGTMALGLGLAGALIGELVLSGSVAVSSGRVLVLNARPLRDPDCQAIVQHMLAEPQHDVRTWLSYLSHSAEDTVAVRLLRAGLVTRESQRRVFTTAMVHRPVDMSFAFWRSARLKQVLAAGRVQSDRQDVVLAGLVFSTGLFRAVLLEDFTTADAVLRRRLMSADRSFREIIAQVATLVGDAVLAIRG
ncbi:GOLPH3/VPS74 family protein [Rugosimonospora africana]|uniref:GOLPH3/VPS74 family protein n=1 Tax=Rugosimonospora africana TaxID=556532 RepID=UPI001941F091|nr:GPP34 family phosphoprotein [Rugosimonospora africana]